MIFNITDIKTGKKKEEEELKRAIALSLQEESNRQVKPPILIAQPAPKPQKSEVKKEPEPVAAPIKEQPLPAEIPKEQKINPVVKNGNNVVGTQTLNVTDSMEYTFENLTSSI